MGRLAILLVIVRVLFGGLFVLSGANKLLIFLPPPELPPAGAAFIAALAATGYMLTVLALIEVVFGGLVIMGRFVPLALTVLAPLVINIAFFHVALAPALPIVVFLVASEMYLAWVYRDAFSRLLQATARTATPSVAGVTRPASVAS